MRQTERWAGGTTEQLFIWPDSAQYASRNFAFRVSTAQIELVESDFTLLPGITRWIMTLSGQIRLSHKDRGQTTISPLEPYCFDGGWETKSFGLCTDFNLMLSPGWSGHISSEPGEYICPPNGFIGVFAYDGPISIAITSIPEGKKNLYLANRDLLVLRGSSSLKVDSGVAVVFMAYLEA